MYDIRYADDVASDLLGLRAYDRQIILDRIDEQLRHQPTTETRTKRVIVGLRPPWQYEEPIWQLRINEYRVFYDVNAEQRQVNVRAIRHKPPHKTTEEIV